MSFIFGLDLGQTTDPTAGVILETQGDGEQRLYLIRHIEEYPLGTPYPRIIEATKTLLGRPPLQGQCELVIDQTGVGRAIFDMFAEAGLRPHGVTITTGHNWHQEAHDQYHVAKILLIGVVQKFLQSERLRSSWRVKHSRLLKKELQNFRVTLTKSAHEQYGPDVRENAHDDKVLATAVALWFGERYTPASGFIIGDPIPSRSWQPVWSRDRRRQLLASWQTYMGRISGDVRQFLQALNRPVERQEPPTVPGGGWTPGSHARQEDHDIEAYLSRRSQNPRYDEPEKRARLRSRPFDGDEIMAKHGWRRIDPDK